MKLHPLLLLSLFTPWPEDLKVLLHALLTVFKSLTAKPLLMLDLNTSSTQKEIFSYFTFTAMKLVTRRSQSLKIAQQEIEHMPTYPKSPIVSWSRGARDGHWAAKFNPLPHVQQRSHHYHSLLWHHSQRSCPKRSPSTRHEEVPGLLDGLPWPWIPCYKVDCSSLTFNTQKRKFLKHLFPQIFLVQCEHVLIWYINVTNNLNLVEWYHIFKQNKNWLSSLERRPHFLSTKWLIPFA